MDGHVTHHWQQALLEDEQSQLCIKSKQFQSDGTVEFFLYYADTATRSEDLCQSVLDNRTVAFSFIF